MGHQVETEYYNGQGVVLLGGYDSSGALLGLETIGNVSGVKLETEASSAEHKESWSGKRAIDKKWDTETKVTATLTLESFTAANLARAIRATLTPVAAGTAADESVTVRLGKIMPLAHLDVSELTLTADSAALEAYAAGDDDGDWDYKLNAAAGSVEWAATPKTTGLADGNVATADYSYGKQASATALTAAAAQVFLRAEMVNTQDSDAPLNVDIWKWQIDPAQELQLLSEDAEAVGNYELSGTVIADLAGHPSSPYYTVTKRAA